MEVEYTILRGKNLLKRLTKDGTEPIGKEVIATLLTEDIEAIISVITNVEDNIASETLRNLLDEDLRRVPLDFQPNFEQ